MTELGQKLTQIRSTTLFLRMLDREDSVFHVRDRERRSQMYSSESQRLKALLAEVIPVIEQEREGLLNFCQMYYIKALPLKETAGLIDRTIRQCERYKAEAERGIRCRKNREDKNHGKQQENDR